MKNTILSFVLVLAATIIMMPKSSLSQSVEFNKSWVEYDITQDGQEGMLFHYDVTIRKCEGMTLKALLFVTDPNITWMKSYNDKYKTIQGSVCSRIDITATYENSNWSDLKIFLPYNAMSIAKDNAKYYYALAIRYLNDSTIKQDIKHEFNWGAHSPSAKIKKIWVDHNHLKDDIKGMLIHALVTVDNMKSAETEFSCFFYDTDDNNIKTDNQSFSSSDGSLVVFERREPRFTSSKWEDFKLFMPYKNFKSLKEIEYYNFRFYIRDPNRDYHVLAASEPQPFNVTFNGNKKKCDDPIIEWLSAYTSDSPTYNAIAGIKSDSELQRVELSVNGSSYRGMKAVQNDGYQQRVSEQVTLRNGSNTIIITATNACGTTTKTYNITYNKQTPVYANNNNKVALVIGNSNYTKNPLKNPVNDANDVGNALRNLGFDVTILTDCTKRQMNNAIFELQKKANANSVALFYYAGHGIQNKGHNYLVPIDAEMNDASDIEYACTDVNQVLDNMEASGCSMNIVVLDACRDEPFTRSWNRSQTSRGLTGIDAPKGTFIAYATSPGRVALDGTGRNSPYAAAFLQTLKFPGLGIFDFFQQVQSQVMNTTSDEQVPWVSSSFIGKFFFNPNN